MKFQKGVVLTEEEKAQLRAAAKQAKPEPKPQPIVLGDVEKNRLFETQEEFAGSSSHYLKVLGVVAVLVLIGGGLLAYFMQPGVGDVIKAPVGMEDAIREHFLTVQKRTATDVVVFKCDGFYWARVGVETRNDLPNPVFRIDKYSARVTPAGETAWNISAQPLQTPSLDTPCQ